MLRRAALPAVVAALAAVILGGLVLTLAVNVPYWDQWELVPVIQKYHEGTLGFADLSAPHNEHRLLIPRTVMLALALLTRWDTRAEVLLNLVLGLGLYLAMRGLPLASDEENWQPAALAWIVFSPAQWQNWLWGWQFQIFICLVGTVVAARALTESRGWRAMALAAWAALISTYSFGGGLVIWLGGASLLAVYRRWRQLAVWSLAAGLAIVPYFWGVHGWPRHGSFTMVRYYPSEFVLYFLAYLGNFFYLPARFAAAAGLVVLAVWILSLGFLARHGPDTLKRLASWHAIAGMALANALAAAFARLRFGYEHATTSRYISLSMLFLAAAVVVARAAAVRLGRRWVSTALAAVFALGVCSSWSVGTVHMLAHHRMLCRIQQCLQHVDSADIACLLSLYEHVELLLPRAHYLAKLGWCGLGGAK